MIANPSILSAIESNGGAIVSSEGFDGRAIMSALTAVESSWGERCEAGLFEPAYYRGGTYYRAVHVREAVARYESFASCSYGPWQILYISALEQGYTGHPFGLADPAISAPYVVKLLNKRVRQPATLPDYADAWNTGNNFDRILPRESYTAGFVSAYHKATEYWGSAA